MIKQFTGIKRPTDGPVKIGPDFICIGMPKAGTTWLYNQLVGAPGFLMPPLKELHFFDLDSNERRSNFFQQLSRKAHAVNAEHLLFRERAAKAETFNDYKLLFKRGGSFVSGDITPAYCGLQHGTVARIARELPEVKIILMLRDPVERTWSFIKTLILLGRLSMDAAKSWVRIRAFLEENNAPGLALATEVWHRWRRHFNVQSIFFDDIENVPAKVVQEIVTNLGVKAKVIDRKLNNRPNEGPKVALLPAVRAGLIGFFEQELNESAIIFGEAGSRWRNKYLA